MTPVTPVTMSSACQIADLVRLFLDRFEQRFFDLASQALRALFAFWTGDGTDAIQLSISVLGSAPPLFAARPLIRQQGYGQRLKSV